MITSISSGAITNNIFAKKNIIEIYHQNRKKLLGRDLLLEGLLLLVSLNETNIYC